MKAFPCWRSHMKHSGPGRCPKPSSSSAAFLMGESPSRVRAEWQPHYFTLKFVISRDTPSRYPELLENPVIPWARLLHSPPPFFWIFPKFPNLCCVTLSKLLNFSDLASLHWETQYWPWRVAVSFTSSRRERHDKVNICGTPFLTLCQTQGRHRVIFCTKQCRG